jgi:hypothetical protein
MAFAVQKANNRIATAMETRNLPTCKCHIITYVKPGTRVHSASSHMPTRTVIATGLQMHSVLHAI